MNVYEKLQKVRVELQNAGLNKSGNNKFAGYKYFELGDFLPTVNRLCLENKLLTVTSFDKELATLTIINAEAPEETVIFTSPQESANLKGCHPIQNVGAVETYQRRYLMMLAFEIVECDALDPVVGADKTDNKSLERVLTNKQLEEMYQLGKEAGYDMKAVDSMVMKKFELKPAELGMKHYMVVINGFKSIIEKGNK